MTKLRKAVHTLEELSREEQRTKTHTSIGPVQNAIGLVSKNRHIELRVREGRWGRDKGSRYGSSYINQKLRGQK